MKVAVITPYYREELKTLRRCHDSVLAQTHSCTHIFVSDGHPRQEISSWEAQHLLLPVAHNDYGNTPRGLGGISALNQGFDAIAYLDADNWYSADHVESLVAFCRANSCAVAFSSRQIVLSTGEYCPFVDTSEADRRHVDTSCFFITAEAAFLAPIWATMDPEMAVLGDRIMFEIVRRRPVRHGWTGRTTLFYETRWELHFRRMGKPPPPDAHLVKDQQMAPVYSRERTLARLGFDPFSPPI